MPKPGPDPPPAPSRAPSGCICLPLRCAAVEASPSATNGRSSARHESVAAA